MPVPSKERVIELLEDVVSGDGYDLEDVTVTSAGKHSAVRVMIDCDAGLELDAVAELSRKISEALDAVDDFGETPYTLEVGTPGVDRPLTLERHWRRARGRKVRLDVGSEKFDARVGPLVGDSVTVVTRDQGVLSTRSVALDEVRSAVVQVEFARPTQAEMDLAGGIIEGRPLPADANTDAENISTLDEGSDK